MTIVDDHDQDPMPELRRLALEHRASMSGWPYCSCHVVYQNRLYHLIGRDPLFSEYCDRHQPQMGSNGSG